MREKPVILGVTRLLRDGSNHDHTFFTLSARFHVPLSRALRNDAFK